MLVEFDTRYVPETIPEDREHSSARARSNASWRGVVAAWLLVGLIGLGFGGLEIAMVLSPHLAGTSPLTGAVIPRHDPACAAPLVPSNLTPSRCLSPAQSMQEQEMQEQDRLLTPGT
ncbi:MAG: hypothetical protein ACREFK_18500 [Stellaceae bacterium]